MKLLTYVKICIVVFLGFEMMSEVFRTFFHEKNNEKRKERDDRFTAYGNDMKVQEIIFVLISRKIVTKVLEVCYFFQLKFKRVLNSITL